MPNNTDSSTQQYTNTNQKNDSSGGQQNATNKICIEASSSKSANDATTLAPESHLLHKSIDPIVAHRIAPAAARSQVSSSAALSRQQETPPRYKY